jgi:hypothetical protein
VNAGTRWAISLAATLALSGCISSSTARHLEAGKGRSQMTVKRDNEKVWIDGVKGFDSGHYASSPHGCQATILSALGETLTYDDLVCYSAFAFRVGVHKEMCPSAGHPCCGYMCIGRSNDALLWRVKSFSYKPGEDRAVFEATACAAIRDSIDRGVPVHYGVEEDGLIVGYADEGRRWLCLHPYHKEGKETFWHDEAKGFAGGKWPWSISVWIEPKPVEERLDHRETVLAALQQAVDMWQTEKRGDYYCGDAAYTHWLAWLRGVDAGTVEKPKDGMQGNGWGYDVLLHSRTIANRWLRSQADGFDGEAKKQLLVAADRYHELAEGLIADLKCPWDLALPPHRFGDWTPAIRQDQIRRLEAAREHDRAAIAAIRKALAGLGG